MASARRAIIKNMHRLRNILLTLALLALPGAAMLPVAARAQSAGGQPDPVQYIVAPDTPSPASTVNIEVQGVGNFLGDSSITWSVNGAVAQSGTGDTTFTFTTGALGHTSVVHLTIDSPTQGTITHTFTFSPSVVNLVWEADTTVPPLFAGKALYSAGAPLSVIAFPTVILSGQRASAGSLSYQWTIDGTPDTADSGLGKNRISFTGNGLNDSEEAAVDVYFGATKVGHGDITIPAVQPGILLYDKDPLRGVVWDKTLPAQGIALNTPEITVAAQPYYFSQAALAAQQLTWSWTLNDNPIEGPDSNEGVLTLRQTGSGAGSADLAVSLQNEDGSELLQAASTALHIAFGTQQSSALASFFGL